MSYETRGDVVLDLGVGSGWTPGVATLAQDGTTVVGAEGSAPPPPPGGTPPTGETQGAPPAPPGGAQPAPQPGLFQYLLPLLLGLFLFMIITQVLGGRKQKKQREEMLSSLRRQDRVQTIGGIIGTVAEIGDNEVVVQTGTSKVRFTRSAIQSVLRAGGGEASPEPAPEPQLESTPA